MRGEGGEGRMEREGEGEGERGERGIEKAVRDFCGRGGLDWGEPQAEGEGGGGGEEGKRGDGMSRQAG